MLRNYFIIALRSLLKNGVYSFINVAGLTIGLACSILILLWVSDELSWDNFHEKKNRLYRVHLNGRGDNNVITNQTAVPLALWDELKNNEPGIKNVTPANWGETYLLSYKDQRLYKDGYAVSEDFLKMFTFPLVAGSVDQQLKDPTTIVISESTAKALFQNEAPIGKIIRFNDAIDLTVSGVTKDTPSNSSFIFDCLIPFTTYMNLEPWVKNSKDNWGNNSFNMYVEIADNTTIEAVEARVKDVVKKHRENSSTEVTFLGMDRWRLYAEFVNGKSTTGQIVYVRMFTIIAVFILVIACINFMNLATARSERRAREVGIRKSIGSRRKELIFQFLGETFVIAFIAFLLAIVFVELSLPLYNTLVSKKLSINYGNPLLWISGVAVVIATGLIAGSYPAFYLSSFQPAAVLKGRVRTGKSGALPRKMMVTLQFFFSIMLIIATLVVYKQLNHLKDRPTGYDQENLVVVDNVGDIGKNYQAIRQELMDKGLASNVCSSNSPITSIYAYMGGVSWPGKREDQRAAFATIGTGYDYTTTMGIQVVEGRDFSDAYNDTLSMMLNKSAVAYMGLENPLGETINWDDKNYKVIGIIDDVIMASPNRKVDPTMVVFDPLWSSSVTLRLTQRTSPHEALQEIEQVFRKYNPAYPFTYRFVDEEFNRKFSSMEFIGRLANVFSALAILISCLGLFGLAAFTAEQRTKEIGIRKVMGASIPGIVVLISKEFALLVLVAFVFAAPLTWWAMSGWLQQYSYRTDIQWWLVGIAGALTLFISLGVVGFQALRAAFGNPVNALRSE